MGGSVKGLITEALKQCEDAGHPVKYDMGQLNKTNSSSTATPKSSTSGKGDKPKETSKPGEKNKEGGGAKDDEGSGAELRTGQLGSILACAIALAFGSGVLLLY